MDWPSEGHTPKLFALIVSVLYAFEVLKAKPGRKLGD